MSSGFEMDERVRRARERFEKTAAASMVDMHGWRLCAVEMDRILRGLPESRSVDTFRVEQRAPRGVE